MSRFIKIGEAARLLGISIQTLRRWEVKNELLPDRKSRGGTRYYDVDNLFGLQNKETDLTIGYARVSSQDQKDDLKRQAERLETFCTARGFRYEIIQDLGSGMNYRKRGLKRLLDMIIKRQIKRLVLTHKDRLLRFGTELVFTLCEIHHIEVVIINQGNEVSFEEELAQDVLEIITVFSARLYGSRSHRNKKLVEVCQDISAIKRMNVITLTHKIQIDPTCKQGKYFLQACGIARFTWNWALAEWEKQYEAGEKPNGLNLKKQFNAIKRAEFPWMYKVTKYASQQPFIFLQKSFERFFNKGSDYPRFKKKGIHDSFYIGNDHIRVEGRRIHIPKLGWVRMCEELRFRGKIISATISRNADKWFVSLNVELIELPAPCESQAGIGVDLGVIRLATLSNGEYFEGPKPLRRLKLKLKRLQRQLSRKEKGSKNRNKARMRVSKIHYRIACIRHDALHKLTTHLTDNFASIAIEDLNVKGMMSNNRFAGSIADMGFREFRRQLEYKAALHNNHIEIVSRWFPSSKRCSDCSAIKEDLKLEDRTFECNSCGLEIDRDLNSAINLFSTVSSTGFKACGEEGSGPFVTSGRNQPL